MAGDIDLVVSDIDGTLVTPDKTITPRAAAAVAALRAAGARFTLVSSRPPRGMAAIARALDVALPFAAFNGGAIVSAELEPLRRISLPPDPARQALAVLEAHGVSAWVFDGADWLITDPHGPRVGLEQRTVGFDPLVVSRLDQRLDAVGKIVGVSDDHARLADAEAAVREALGPAGSASRSQAYYLDITPCGADKGSAVLALCARLGVDPARTAVIGDMANDVAMFQVAGLSVAMGQAPAAVQAEALAVTAANTAEGFARAVEEIILPRIG
ncbi:HAD family hydrolase [Caulobacter sp. KR2-114]|uniref:HAD family hydrolase n=1 Tax=Caulobacter sp. KR2-114 TaxID=3400912 RepID=UPI003BFBD7AD